MTNPLIDAEHHHNRMYLDNRDPETREVICSLMDLTYELIEAMKALSKSCGGIRPAKSSISTEELAWQSFDESVAKAEKFLVDSCL